MGTRPPSTAACAQHVRHAAGCCARPVHGVWTAVRRTTLTCDKERTGCVWKKLRMNRALRPLLAVAVIALAVPLPTLTRQAHAAPTRVPIAQFTPLPAAPTVSPAARAVRDELLGDHWDDPAYVTLHWTGVSSFVITIGGHLLLFDAWEIIGAVEDYVPIGREELAALDPEAILVGHGHFDHAGDAGYVAGLAAPSSSAARRSAPSARRARRREGGPTDFTCAITGTMTSPAPGTAAPLKLFADLDPVTVLQHIHSDTSPPGGGNELDPFVPVMDPQPYIEHFQRQPRGAGALPRAAEREQPGRHVALPLPDRGASLSLLGDSAGPIFDQPAVQQALDAFPGCIDVMANAILGFDQPVSGLQDPRLYVQYGHPKVFVPDARRRVGAGPLGRPGGSTPTSWPARSTRCRTRRRSTTCSTRRTTWTSARTASPTRSGSPPCPARAAPPSTATARQARSSHRRRPRRADRRCPAPVRQGRRPCSDSPASWSRAWFSGGEPSRPSTRTGRGRRRVSRARRSTLGAPPARSRWSSRRGRSAGSARRRAR